MSILADRQIKELCTVPNWVVTELIPSPNISDVHFYPTETTRFSHESKDKLDILVQRYNASKSIYGVNNCTGVKSYRPLTEKEVSEFNPMISPFVPHQVRANKEELTYKEVNAIRGLPEEKWPKDYFLDFENQEFMREEKIISYGLSSAGYDVRLADEYKIFSNINNIVIDPLAFDDKCLYDAKGPYCIIPPNSYILGRTIEYFKIPKDVMVVCVGKSTYARLGGIINVTPIEPGFEGNVVIEISNSTSLPLKVYANMGISQFLFFKMNENCEVSYADGNRKYQGQTGITIAKV